MGTRRTIPLILATAVLAVLPASLLGEPDEAVPGRCILMFKTPVAERIDDVIERGGALSQACGDPSLDAVFARFGVTGMTRLFPDVDLAIKNRGELSVREAYDAFQAKILARFPRRTARAPAGIKHIDTFGIYVLTFDTAHSPGVVCRALEETGHVVYAEPDRIRRIDYTPSSNTLWNALWGIRRIDCELAWDTAAGAGVIVAVIDTGVDRNHQDLVNRLWVNGVEAGGSAGVDDDTNGHIDDFNGWDFVGNDNNPNDFGVGHGTHCSGTVLADDNNVGVVGVAYLAQLMCLKGLGSGGGSDTDLNNCLNYAINEGASVMSNSWGGNGFSSTYFATINNAVAAGVIPVFAMGNDDKDGTIHGPSNHPVAFSVAASQQTDGRATFSNFGIKVDVTAPGVAIRSTEPGDQYQNLQGTSMATPHVSGAIAVLISDLNARSQTASAEQIRQILRTSADDREAPGWDKREAYGRLNVNNMLGVTANTICEAKITSPDASAPVLSTTINIQGSAWAPGGNFQNYTLEYAPGQVYDSVSWTTITTSSSTVRGGSLHNWDVSGLADGRYTIRLTARNSSNAPFRDRIEFVRDTVSDDIYQNAVEVTGNPLTHAVTYDRNFGNNDDDWFVMECVAGTAYEFRTTMLTGKTDTVIDLYSSPTSSAIASNDDWPQAGEKESRLTWNCSSSGTYFIKVHGWTGGSLPNPDVGSYRIHFYGLFKDGHESDAGSAQAQAITANGTAGHYSIVPAGDVDWIRFDAVAGRTYTASVTKVNASGSTNLDLYDTDGSTLLTSGSAGSDNRVRVTGWSCPATGTYYLRVSAAGSDAGHYRVRVLEKQDFLFLEDFQTVGDALWTPSTG
ncbi:MAG: S8 family serine peptidase, partial [Planctomycetota bacterium]